jgi:hypothetical protein
MKFVKLGRGYVNLSQVTHIDLFANPAVLYLSDGHTVNLSQVEMERVVPMMERSTQEG